MENLDLEKRYYRIIEERPPTLDSINTILGVYNGIHVSTYRDDFNIIYRKFIAYLDEHEIIILKLRFDHMHFSILSNTELHDLRKKGFIR